jgi:hypothetical protein
MRECKAGGRRGMQGAHEAGRSHSSSSSSSMHADARVSHGQDMVAAASSGSGRKRMGVAMLPRLLYAPLVALCLERVYEFRQG